MSKPYAQQDLSDQFDSDLIWRRKELSDMKAAVRRADAASKPVLLRALITMSYAHWEGNVRVCAKAYFEYLTLRKLQYSALERQIYVNSFLDRLGAMNKTPHQACGGFSAWPELFGRSCWCAVPHTGDRYTADTPPFRRDDRACRRAEHRAGTLASFACP